MIALMLKTLSQQNSIHVYNRTPKGLEDRDAAAKKKDADLLNKLHLALPKELKLSDATPHSRQSKIPEQDIYKELSGFAKYKPEVKQMLITAL